MAITIGDINLQKFLGKVAPASFPEAGKLSIADAEWLKIASLLKIDIQLQRLGMK